MRKKSGRIFFRGFLKSCLYLGIFIILFLASYKITGNYLKRKDTKQAGSTGLNIAMKTQGKLDDVAYNLIFNIDKSSKELQDAVLEILNTNTDCLVYMTIPKNAKFTMSQELYQTVREKNRGVPQIVSFENFHNYIASEQYYDFGTTLLEDTLNVDISFYTVVTSDVFEDIFHEEENRLVLSDSVKDTVKDYTEQNIITYLTDFYKCTACNLSLENRLTYTPALARIESEDIIFSVLPGEADGSEYVADLQKTGDIFNAINAGRTAKEVMELAGLAEQVSLGKNIQVLNGSKITGLAKEVKEKLQADGYVVTDIGNYSSSDVPETIIQVKEEGLGKDLISYFHSAAVECVEDLQEGVDVRIILGKSESVQSL